LEHLKNKQNFRVKERDYCMTDLIGVNLKRGNFKEANLEGTRLIRANFEGANLKGANLQEANLQEANLQGTNLQEANLQDAALYEADLQEANLYETVNLSLDQLSHVKTLHNAIIDIKLLIPLKEKYPCLFEVPEMHRGPRVSRHLICKIRELQVLKDQDLPGTQESGITETFSDKKFLFFRFYI